MNALAHRDYTRLGAVHVRWQQGDALTVSNPGGFVEGVTLENPLVVEPRPRNPALADALKRLGLAERTGRGVDLIYQGLLRYGRPAPSYARSDRSGVVVELQAQPADLEFLKVVLEQEQRTGQTLTVEALPVEAFAPIVDVHAAPRPCSTTALYDRALRPCSATVLCDRAPRPCATTVRYDRAPRPRSTTVHEDRQ